MKITSGGIQITTAHTVLTASEVAGEGSTANKSSSGPELITITINALNDLKNSGRLNDDGNYYGIIFPGDYIAGRGTADDPFADMRTTGTGAIDHANSFNVIFNIPVGMNIGANTSGNYGNLVFGFATTAFGARYEERKDWDAAWTDPARQQFGQYSSDPSLVINLDTDEWDIAALANVNITINNSGNTIGAGGTGGYGGATGYSFSGVKWHGGGGGGAGQGLHPDPWPAGTKFQASDNFSSGAWIAGQAGGGFETGTAAGWGTEGIQGTLTAGGGGGSKGPSSTTQAGTGSAGHVGGSAIYVKSNVASVVTGSTISIINKSTGRMYGGGGGGGGGFSSDGGAGGDMTTGGASNFGSDGSNNGDTGQPVSGGRAYPGGWQGNILWVHTANLAITNTITNQSSTAIAGWDGVWA